jgi:hypothetical protein
MHSDQRTAPAVEFDHVVITSQLQKRPSRHIDVQKENAAFRELADHLAADPDKLLQRLVEIMLKLCEADTVGISVEQTDDKGARIFRWVAMAGALKHLIGGTTPRNFSPCGVCVDQNQPLLMERLDRVYTYFKKRRCHLSRPYCFRGKSKVILRVRSGSWRIAIGGNLIAKMCA